MFTADPVPGVLHSLSMTNAIVINEGMSTPRLTFISRDNTYPPLIIGSVMTILLIKVMCPLCSVTVGDKV